MIKTTDVVPYKLSEWDITAAHEKAKKLGLTFQDSKGNIVPLIVVRVWQNEYGTQPGVNGQVILDGEFTLWVTSVREYVGEYWGNSGLEYNDHETPVK